MKQKISWIFLVLFLCVSLPGCGGSQGGKSPLAPQREEALLSEEEKLALPLEEGFTMKGMWLSQFDLQQVYLFAGKQRLKEDFTARMASILSSVKQMGFDTVVVQVHPYGDSFYPSEFFPPSPYVTGAYGRELSYDPFRVVEQLCQELSLGLHAWINPMRLMKESEISLLAPSHPLRQCYEEQTGEVLVWEGRCYFNPAVSEVREWIASAAEELCRNYAIEAVHIDDYFYPTTEESFDESSYRAYRQQGGGLSLGDYRRENVSQMVRRLYEGVKRTDPQKLFGISPAGNVDYAYDTVYADVIRWCREEGFADYICPQLYFGFEHEKCPFAKTLQQWRELCKGTRVDLVVGLTLTKASLAEDPYAGSGRYEWAGEEDIVMRSAALAAREGDCVGICVFSYSYFLDPLGGQGPEASAKEAANLLSVLPTLFFQSSHNR